jgi:hypothetical protein
MTGFASKRAMARDDDIIDDLTKRMAEELHNDVINGLAKRMAQDIDDAVLMTAMGWTPFEISSGRVYGSEYLTVHPTNGNHWSEMMKWMVDTFGPSANNGVWTPNIRWYANNSKFWFRDQKDLTMFILRWS